MNVISIDIETTGLDCLHDDVIEFAVHNDVGTSHMYLVSDVESASEALRRHHLTREILAERAMFDDRSKSLEMIASMIADRSTCVVSHNVGFVFTMLACNMIREGIDESILRSFMGTTSAIDIMVMDVMLNPNDHSRSRALSSLCDLYDIRHRPDGSAMRDSRCISEISDVQIGLLLNGDDPTDDRMRALMNLVRDRAFEQQRDRNRWLHDHDRDDEVSIGYPINLDMCSRLE